ncbi:MAG: hypothetical protein JNK48_04420 [Bryobacterales bacterium]|nr:hypothetical protein [Bryobacterales bacterium]
MFRDVIKPLLRRSLSPRSYEMLRIAHWYTGYYVPRSIASPFTKRHPAVHGFGNPGVLGPLVKQIEGVNALAPTRMCRVMTRHGSDKAKWWHNYTSVYSVLFAELLQRPLRIFELGLGTNNPSLVSSMGTYGQPGASLRGWRELFPKALVYGADIDRDVLFESERIKTYYCDQLDQGAIAQLWGERDFEQGLDVIIEDGLHTFEGNVSFLQGSIGHLRPGGYYVVEDIQSSLIGKWKEFLARECVERYPALALALVELPNTSNSFDNNLLVIRRG